MKPYELRDRVDGQLRHVQTHLEIAHLALGIEDDTTWLNALTKAAGHLTAAQALAAKLDEAKRTEQLDAEAAVEWRQQSRIGRR